MGYDFMSRRFWLAGELAAEVGVSTDTLRHYERKGVLPCPRRSSNGYRQYPPETIERVKTVRRALAVGFTLDELAEILGERDRGGMPCRHVFNLANEKLAAVETQLAELAQLRDQLESIIFDWKGRLESMPENGRAELLNAIPGGAATKNTNPSPKFKKRKS